MDNMQLSSCEINEKIKATHLSGKKTIAFLPVGCIEQHGPFLPIETDSLIATEITKKICHKITDKRYWGYVFQTIHYTPSQSNINYCGTVSVDDEGFRSYIRSICKSILKSAFDAIAIICGHDTAMPSLKEIGFKLVNNQFINRDNKVKPVVVIGLLECSSELEKKFKQKPGRHADWREFLMLYKILGKDYFSSKRINDLKNFRNKANFNIQTSAILGIPLEYRSTYGVIGEPFPKIDSNLDKLSEKIWNIHLQHLLNMLCHSLESFWNDYSKI